MRNTKSTEHNRQCGYTHSNYNSYNSSCVPDFLHQPPPFSIIPSALSGHPSDTHGAYAWPLVTYPSTLQHPLNIMHREWLNFFGDLYATLFQPHYSRSHSNTLATGKHGLHLCATFNGNTDLSCTGQAQITIRIITFAAIPRGCLVKWRDRWIPLMKKSALQRLTLSQTDPETPSWSRGNVVVQPVVSCTDRCSRTSHGTNCRHTMSPTLEKWLALRPHAGTRSP